jgi:catechol 2,3-dioxygenase-like lactoylglutathione lyase family enzyme
MVLPVSDVDRAKDFYADKLGFNVDVDHSAGDAFRVVQLTPPGSACSVSVGKGLTESAPGSVQGMHLVVTDIDKAWSLLVERGVEASEIFHFGANGRESGPQPDHEDYGSFVTFNDPDGNGWVVQEVRRDGSPA